VTRLIGSTACEVSGEGPPLVLVHGLGASHAMWMWQADALAERFTVVRYDLLGHGESGDPTLPCRMSHFTDQLANLLDGLGIGACGFAGFSLGGMIVRAFALAHPGRVAALAILNSAHDRTDAERAAVLARVKQAEEAGPAATIDTALERWFTPAFAASHPEILDEVRRWVLANDATVYSSIYRLLAEGDGPLAGTIAAIRCPTLVITGGDDPGNTPDMARRMAALIPGARVEILPGLRHMGLAEDPATFNALLIPFFEDALGGA
jgi:pimeloyl-ACP methyl ester carboxylesterase